MPRTGERGGPQTRAKIADVAGRLFLERGFDGVTVADIAREAGVSSVTVFNHFPRKEDLFFDRTIDAVDFLRSAVRDRGPGVDVLASLHATVLRLIDDQHPLSGVNDRSVPFFRTVAGSPVLIARTREIASELQHVLAEELAHDETTHGNAALLAAFFIGGYSALLVETARRRIAGETQMVAAEDARSRVEALFDALRYGVDPTRTRG